MAAPFVGNQDYRGYLNYLGTQGDTQAKNLLGAVGNDAVIDPRLKQLGATPSYVQQLTNANTKYFANYNKLNIAPPQNIGSIYGGGGGGPAPPPPPVYAPKLDIAAVNATARAGAESTVNPYYTKTLNEFLTNQAQLQQQQQQQSEIDIKNADQLRDITNKNIAKNLEDTLKGYDVTKDRTITDVGTNKASINQKADYFQTDSGTQANTDRLDASRKIASSGLTGGGLGNQQIESGQLARNETERRQEEQSQAARDQQTLFQDRTLEDLLTAGEGAKTKAGQATEQSNITTAQREAQSKFDLDNYIKQYGVGGGNTLEERVANSGTAIKAKRDDLEKARLEQVLSETKNQAKQGFLNYLAGVADPAKYAAAVNTYGGLF